MARKSMTIEDLALIVKNGFDNSATKQDVEALWTEVKGIRGEMATKKEMGEKFQHVISRLDTLRHDISDLPVLREGVRELHHRIERLEKKVAGMR